MNERINQLFEQARTDCNQLGNKPATTVGYDELERFAELVRQDEREACAKLCESYVGATFDMCAKAIREGENT